LVSAGSDRSAADPAGVASKEAQEPMGVGDRLRQRRQDRGLTLEDLAARTRIAPRVLQAIEREEFGAVPSGIFLRGHLRACARELGMDPESLVEQYRVEHQAPVAPAVNDRLEAAPEPVRPVLSVEPRLAHAAAARVPPVTEAAEDASARPNRRLARVPPLPHVLVPRASTAALVIGGVLLVALVARVARQPEVTTPADTRVGAPAASPASASAGPVGTTGSEVPGTKVPRSGAATTGTAAAAPLRVALTATRRVWVTAHADGARVIYRLLETDEQVSISGTQQVTLRVGDAGAVLASVNGGPARPLGGSGEVRTLSFGRK
jgi:cytoskeletal protein RodZ